MRAIDPNAEAAAAYIATARTIFAEAFPGQDFDALS